MKPRFVPCMTLLLVFAFAQLSTPAQGKFPTNIPKAPLNTLTDQEKADGWKLLFNGQNLDGWGFDEKAPRGEWTVKDGIIVSTKGTTHLFTEKTYKNFEASWDLCAYDAAVPKVRYGNSGVFLRGVKTGQAFPKGYEIQVDPYDQNNPTGGVYGVKAPGNLLVDEKGNWKPEAFFDVHEGKWINQRVRIEGNHITIWVNGKKTLDWEDEQKRFPEAGYISLQNHHPTCVVLFTNIKIKELP